MEDMLSSVLSAVINNDTLVLTILITGIAVVLLALLVLNFSAPESVIISEYGSSDEFETTLRKVLSDTELKSSGRANNALEEYQLEQMSGRVEKLENEVLEKDQTIADLNKRLTASGGGTTVDGVMAADANELQDKIKDLQARLHEYEIIEDDIADLSKFKDQNDELKEEIEKLRAKLASMTTAEPAADSGKASAELNITQPEKGGVDTEFHGEDVPELEEASGADLVAEFEKVVNNQETGDSSGEEPQIEASQAIDDGNVTGETDVDYGEIMLSKLQEMNITPDSKEEAEVLISDLRSLKLSENDLDELGKDAGGAEEKPNNEGIKEDSDEDKKDVS